MHCSLANTAFRKPQLKVPYKYLAGFAGNTESWQALRPQARPQACDRSETSITQISLQQLQLPVPQRRWFSPVASYNVPTKCWTRHSPINPNLNISDRTRSAPIPRDVVPLVLVLRALVVRGSSSCSADRPLRQWQRTAGLYQIRSSPLST